jgi:protein-tyrosine phosphatase
MMFWIQNGFNIRLAIVRRPLGAEWLVQELRLFREHRLDVLVSLLTPQEVSDLGLCEEGKQAATFDIEFIHFPIEDHGVPKSISATRDVVDLLSTKLSAGKSVGIHCRASIGRSSLLAACVLCSYGLTPETAFATIREARGIDVPDTDKQFHWVEDFAAEPFC